jgi:uncharacterized protein (DUF2225 family)
MARLIICDVCEVTYTEGRHDHQTVELNGKTFKVFLDMDGETSPDFYRLDVCPACRKQALLKVIEQEPV